MKKSLLLVSALGLAACSAQYDSGNALERWYNFHTNSISQQKMEEWQAVAVFYRGAEFDGEAVNVYVNGDYQASLAKESFSPVSVCANRPLFSLSFSRSHKFGNRTDGVRYNLTAGQVNYIKVVQTANGQLAFEQVDEATAKTDFVKLKGEIRHTLPRVTTKNDCNHNVYTLSASALWGSNKHSYQDMLPQGKKEIAEFAEYVKQSGITRIDVKGFTDPEGADAYNMALSQKRADTVRQALLNAGVTQPINAVGYGETHLVVANCAAQHSKDRQARNDCNLPNRRVEIETHGN